MKIMMRKTLATFLKTSLFVCFFICFFIVGITACSPHKNPLTTEKPQAVVKFLMAASNYAVNKINYFDSMHDGSDYGFCMDNYSGLESAKQKTCDSIYQAMVGYAKKDKKQSGFQSLTVADLKDQKAYSKIESAYKAEVNFGQYNKVGIKTQ